MRTTNPQQRMKNKSSKIIESFVRSSRCSLVGYKRLSFVTFLYFDNFQNHTMSLRSGTVRIALILRWSASPPLTFWQRLLFQSKIIKIMKIGKTKWGKRTITWRIIVVTNTFFFFLSWNKKKKKWLRIDILWWPYWQSKLRSF